MAKVTGPLHSVQAHGALGGTIVFRQTKNGPVAQKNPPRDKRPQPSRAQYAYIFRICAVAIHWVNTTNQTLNGNGTRDEDRVRAVKPDHFTWNAWLTHCMVGKRGVNWHAADDITHDWGDTEYEAWDAAADALLPPSPVVANKGSYNPDQEVIANGLVLLHLMFGLAAAGLASVPGATPPTYV